MMLNLENIEKKQHVKLPEEYKQLYQSGFQEFNDRMKIHVNDDVFGIQKFLSAAEISDILEEFYDYFGYDIVPIAEADYDDYICLYYKENTNKPSVIYWNYELAVENPEEGILFLYNDLHDFINNLRFINGKV